MGVEMNRLKSASVLEKVTGNVVTESALTLVSVVAGGALTALLPVLSKSLASARHSQRVESALADISEVLEEHAGILKELTDSQFKLINEAVLTILQTTNDEKLRYLRRVVENGMAMDDLDHQEATILPRIIRDISAEEIEFLVRNASYKKIQLGIISSDVLSETVLTVPADGDNELIVSGLISLGLVISAGPTMDDSGLLKFSSGVSKLITLLKEA